MDKKLVVDAHPWHQPISVRRQGPPVTRSTPTDRSASLPQLSLFTVLLLRFGFVLVDVVGSLTATFLGRLAACGHAVPFGMGAVEHGPAQGAQPAAEGALVGLHTPVVTAARAGRPLPGRAHRRELGRL